MLEGRELQFRYSSRHPWLLRGVGLRLSSGEVLGLRGSSGEGKSTLAKLLAGYLEPSSGRVEVGGQPLPKKSYCPVQLVFQHPELTFNPRFRMGAALHEAGLEAGEMCEMSVALGIEPQWLQRYPHQLSSGELQRFALARALGPRTRYLIADEITAMLDPVSQASLWSYLLSQVERRKIGMLVISHDRALLERIVDHTVCLRDCSLESTAPDVVGQREVGVFSW